MTDRATSYLPVETVALEGCSLDELCRWCEADADWVADIVAHGIVDPSGSQRSQWRFTSISVARVSKAKRLQRDLDLNVPGVAVVLELLDEIERLRYLRRQDV
jgi:chaperone modulatory protein CbpM